MRRRNLFTFIDLFAGIGGMRKGFEAIGGRCVFTSEQDIHAQKTYRANFPDDLPELTGDITKVRSEDIPSHDVLLAGFACQAQGVLFFEIVRILAFHRPKAFLLENVKNLTRHDEGRTWRMILHTLSVGLGYLIQFRTLNARFWVPQNRERVFIVGFREETGFLFENMAVPELLTAPVLRDILHAEDGSEAAEEPYTKGCHARVADKYTLSDQVWQSLQSHARRHRIKGHGFGYSLASPEDVSRTLSARYGKDGSEILIPQFLHNPRRLTPRECSRLMGFDKPGESRFRIPVSDTQAYRQFGNAVAVPVVETIARQMAPSIEASVPSRDLHKTRDEDRTPLPCQQRVSTPSQERYP